MTVWRQSLKLPRQPLLPPFSYRTTISHRLALCSSHLLSVTPLQASLQVSVKLNMRTRTQTGVVGMASIQLRIPELRAWLDIWLPALHPCPWCRILSFSFSPIFNFFVQARIKSILSNSFVLLFFFCLVALTHRIPCLSLCDRQYVKTLHLQSNYGVFAYLR